MLQPAGRPAGRAEHVDQQQLRALKVRDLAELARSWICYRSTRMSDCMDAVRRTASGVLKPAGFPRPL